jgi:hypothetical protein
MLRSPVHQSLWLLSTDLAGSSASSSTSSNSTSVVVDDEDRSPFSLLSKDMFTYDNTCHPEIKASKSC